MDNQAGKTQQKSRTSGTDTDGIAAELIGLLHANAPGDAFAERLAVLEALPDGMRQKTGLIELARMAMALRNRLDLHEQRERGMLAVTESAQDLASRLDLPELLKAIAARARDLLRAHLCWLSVYDADSGEFRALVADGAITQRPGRMTARRELGVAGVVLSTRLPFSTPDYLNDDRFIHDPELDEIFRGEGVGAVVGAPLIWDDEVIGLLFVADRYHRTHTALSVSILCTLATHAAVAINNAKAFADAQSALENARQARAALEEHARDVQAAVEAHERLTSLLARGASLGELCQDVAQLLEGSILVLDEAQHVIARATAPGYQGRAADAYDPYGPYGAAIAQALRDSRRAGRSAIAYESDGELCRAIAVIGGDGVLGAVLLFRRDDMRDISIRTFERSSSVIGIVLLSQERTEANKSRDVSQLLQSLISPRQGEPAPTRDRAERFGLDLSQPLSLMLVESEQRDPVSLARRARAVMDQPGVVLDDVDGVLVVVCGAGGTAGATGPGGAGPARGQGRQGGQGGQGGASGHGGASTVAAATRAFGDFARRELGDAYRGVLSRPVRNVADMPALYAALRRALAIMGRLGMRGRVVGQHELALYSALFESQDRAGLRAFLDGAIGPIIAHDRRRGTDLAATLLAYFDHHQNATNTAGALDLHVNTVRQRLATIEALIADWRDPARALEIHVALRLWRIGITEDRAPSPAS